MFIRSTAFIGLVLACISSYGQNLPASRSNTVKLDLSSQVIYSKALILAYERVTKTNQSLVVTAGYHAFPTLVNLGSNIRVTDDNKRSGYVVGAEYRFYLVKENKYAAPHGVYLGPYMTYHQFSNNRNIEVTNADGTLSQAILDTKFNVFNLGVQLGYQFIINDRWSIDFAFIGPSTSYYSADLDLGGSFNPDELSQHQQEILQALADKFPFLKDLVEGKTVSASGKSSTWSFGYRYFFQVGYHFGRKR
ncbi:MAG TPA: DUF3575 domain-containing protein [Chryseolinea sp.]